MPDGEKIYTEAELQAAIRERVKAITQERDALQVKVAEIEPRAKSVDTITQERDQARADLAHERAASATFRAAASNGILDPERVAALEFLHGRAMAAVPEKDRVPFEKWIAQDGPGRTHPAASAFFQAAPGPAPQGPQGGPAPAGAGAPAPGGAPAPAGLPSAPAGSPAAPPKSLDQRRAEVQTYLRSAEYRALPIPEQKKKHAEFMRELDGLRTAPPA